ncbi:MAG: copper chaperone PCu(A)C [Pseudonocardiaceae bacterium]
MSRRHQLMRTSRPLVSLVVACCAAVLALVGCGAGQVTQTDSQVAVIDGASGDVGRIALRDVLIPYPDAGHGSYPVGSNVPLRFTIVNQGNSADELVSVTTPVARRVQVEGNTTIPAGMSVTNAGDAEHGASPAPSSRPASPLDFGELRIVLIEINREPRPGLNTEITFVFRDAGSVTLPVPMGPPAESERKPLDEGGHS